MTQWANAWRLRSQQLCEVEGAGVGRRPGRQQGAPWEALEDTWGLGFILKGCRVARKDCRIQGEATGKV